MSSQWHGGKGSKPRPFSVSQETFDNNWDAIFKKKENKMQVRADQIKEGGVSCGCGRSPTGFCCGWHGLSEEQYEHQKRMYIEEQFRKDQDSNDAN